jgi:hypothetical protein
MSNETERTTPVLLVYLGVRLDQKGTGLDHYWLHVTAEEFAAGTMPADLRSRSRNYSGKESRKHMTGSPGTTYEVPEVVGGEHSSIYPGSATFKGLWPDQEMRTQWQVEHRTATTTVDLRKRGKHESSEDNFGVLAPFRAKYHKLISQDQRAALLAQMIAYVTR